MVNFSRLRGKICFYYICKDNIVDQRLAFVLEITVKISYNCCCIVNNCKVDEIFMNASIKCFHWEFPQFEINHMEKNSNVSISQIHL